MMPEEATMNKIAASILVNVFKRSLKFSLMMLLTGLGSKHLLSRQAIT